MTKPKDSTPPSKVVRFSSKTLPMSEREFLVEMERLSISHPRAGAAQMDQKAWRVLFRVLWEDMQHLDLLGLRAGIGRYRRNPENKFFPTSGQLLEACRNPFETATPAHRKPAYTDDLPPAMDREHALELIEQTRKKLNYPPDERSAIEKRKAEILARPPMPYVASDPKMLALLKANAAKREREKSW